MLLENIIKNYRNMVSLHYSILVQKNLYYYIKELYRN